MSLTQWAENGWLRRHRTSRDEIDNLLKIVDRDLRKNGTLVQKILHPSGARGGKICWPLKNPYSPISPSSSLVFAASSSRSPLVSTFRRSTDSVFDLRMLNRNFSASKLRPSV
jgi:hypothetical protein